MQEHDDYIVGLQLLLHSACVQGTNRQRPVVMYRCRFSGTALNAPFWASAITCSRGPIPVLAPCGPHITLFRANGHTRGNIWKFSVESLQSCGIRGLSPEEAICSSTKAALIWSRRQFFHHRFLQEIVILGVIYGS